MKASVEPPTASMEASIASMKASVEASAKPSIEDWRKLPWKIWKLAWKKNPGSSHGSFRESFHGSSFHENLEATSTEFYILLPWKLPQLPRNLRGFLDSSHGYICIVHY